MAIFDMDDTILKGRFINECAKKFGFFPNLKICGCAKKIPIILTKRIGVLLRGRTMDDLLDVISSIDMVEDIRQCGKRPEGKRVSDRNNQQ